MKRFATALKDLGVKQGRRRRHLPADDPRGRGGDARLRRIGAPHNVVFGGFSAEAVRERMEFSDAKVLITVDGAARKGKHRARSRIASMR